MKVKRYVLSKTRQGKSVFRNRIFLFVCLFVFFFFFFFVSGPDPGKISIRIRIRIQGVQDLLACLLSVTNILASCGHTLLSVSICVMICFLKKPWLLTLGKILFSEQWGGGGGGPCFPDRYRDLWLLVSRLCWKVQQQEKDADRRKIYHRTWLQFWTLGNITGWIFEKCTPFRGRLWVGGEKGVGGKNVKEN